MLNYSPISAPRYHFKQMTQPRLLVTLRGDSVILFCIYSFIYLTQLYQIKHCKPDMKCRNQLQLCSSVLHTVHPQNGLLLLPCFFFIFHFIWTFTDPLPNTSLIHAVVLSLMSSLFRLSSVSTQPLSHTVRCNLYLFLCLSLSFTAQLSAVSAALSRSNLAALNGATVETRQCRLPTMLLALI